MFKRLASCSSGILVVSANEPAIELYTSITTCSALSFLEEDIRSLKLSNITHIKISNKFNPCHGNRNSRTGQNGRRLKQDPPEEDAEPGSDGTYTITLTAQRCAQGLPITDAAVTALLANQLVNDTITLIQTPAGSNTYTANLDLESTNFGNIVLTAQVTVSYCSSNKRAVERACGIGLPRGANNTFNAESLYLDCRRFETAAGALVADQVQLSSSSPFKLSSLICQKYAHHP